MEEEKFSAISQLQTLHSTAILELGQKHVENLRHVRTEMEGMATERKNDMDSNSNQLKEKLACSKEEFCSK